MKWVLVIIVLGFVSCAKEIVLTDEEIKPDVFYADQGHKPYTGICKIVYYNSDKIKEEFRFKKGRLDGEFYSYYKNGNLRWKGCYCDGMITGTWRKWDDAGRLIMEVNYVNDTLEGSFITMYPNGNIRGKGSYTRNRRVGKWTLRDESGKLISKQ